MRKLTSGNLLNFLLLLFILAFSSSCKKSGVDKSTNGKDDDRKTYNLGDATTLWGIITDESGLSVENVAVTDGFTVTKTNNKGVYQLVKNPRAKFVYYSTPSQFKIGVDADNNPNFYTKLNQTSSLIRKDFKLSADNVSDNWTLICIGDPQVTTLDNVTRYNEETLADIDRTVNQIKANGNQEIYAITLGDIVHNVYDLYPLMRSVMSKRTLPFFHLPGNHDQEYVDDKVAHEIYENHFGPRNYSFDRGNAHVVVIDNYIMNNTISDGLTDEIWAWLQADLALVPKDKMVILCAHVPFENGTGVQYGKEVIELLKTFSESHIMTGHSHTNYKWKHDNNPSSKLTEHTHGTACGAHWRSTVCLDGTPNGYAIYQIKGNKIADYYYKATGEQFDRNYQMRLYDGATRFYSNDLSYFFNSVYGAINNRIVANIWNADLTWEITLEEDGYAPVNMIRTNVGVLDYAAYTYHLYYKSKNWATKTNHFWHCLLPSGKKPAEANFVIKAKDVRNNITYTSSSSPAKPNIQMDYTGIAYP